MTFGKTYEKLIPDRVGAIVIGDLNIHHRSWLTYSSNNTSDGRLMQGVAAELNLSQCVRGPTHVKGHQLDLVLTDLQAMCKTEVHAPIADHHLVESIFDVTTMSSYTVERDVWYWDTADWVGLKQSLIDFDFESIFERGTDDMVLFFVNTIQRLARQHVRHSTKTFTSKSHPWLTETAAEAIKAKCEAFGTGHFNEASKNAKMVVAYEYKRYREKLRDELRKLPKASKMWWKINREILQKTTRVTSIPTL